MDDHRPGLAVAGRAPAPPPEPPAHDWPRVAAIALIVLAALAVLYTFYFAAELILPIVLAIVIKVTLQPAMRLLHERLRLPNPMAAVVLIVALFGLVGGIGFTLSVPAGAWLAKAPESLSVLEQRLRVLKRPLAVLQHAAQRLEQATGGDNEPSVKVKEPGIESSLFHGTKAMLGPLVTLVVTLFFLLSSGDVFLRRMVEILPSLSDKKRAVEIVNGVEHNISIYLLTITIMNLLVGVVTGLTMWACGLGDPLLWGAVAFLLNYLPILGPLAGVVMFFLVGLLSFPSAWLALVPAGLYLLIHIAEGEVITPMLLARRFTLNPVLVIVSLFVWYWIWGVPGALLAVPLLGMAKLMCDNIPSLAPVGHLLGTTATRGDNGQA